MTSFVLLDNEMYYIDNKNHQIKRYKDNKNLYTIKSRWMLGETTEYLLDFARLSTDGKDLLFSLSDGIYKFNVKTNKATLIHKPQLTGRFSVYGFMYENGLLIYDRAVSHVFDNTTKALYGQKVVYS